MKSVIIKSSENFESFMVGLKNRTEQFSDVTLYIDEISEDQLEKQFKSLKRKKIQIETETLTFRLTSIQKTIVIPDCINARTVSFTQENPSKISSITIVSSDKLFENIRFVRAFVESSKITGENVFVDMCYLCEIDETKFREFENMTKHKLVLEKSKINPAIQKTKDIKVCCYVTENFEEDSVIKYETPNCCDALSFITSGVVNLRLALKKQEIHSINFYSQYSNEDRQKAEIFGVNKITELRLIYNAEDTIDSVANTFLLSVDQGKVDTMLIENVPKVTLNLCSIESLTITLRNINGIFKMFADPVTIEKMLIELKTKVSKITLFCNFIKDIKVISKKFEFVRKCYFVIKTEHNIQSFKVRYKTNTDDNNKTNPEANQRVYFINLKSKMHIESFSVKRLTVKNRT